MGFLAPWFLAGLAALGLPIWLHLLRQHRKTPFPFSSLMFFERRLTSSMRARRLRYLLLFALRMLLFLLMALAFAEPFVQRSAIRSDDVLTVIAVDRSFSMQYGGNLEAAKAEAERLLASLPRRSAIAVLALDAHVETLADRSADQAQARQAIESIKASALPSSFGEFARVLRSTENSTNRPIDAHLFSDLQRSSMPKAFTDLELGPRTELALHPIGSPTNANWAIESATASNISDAAERSARVTATVAGTNTEAAEESVSLSIDGKTVGTKNALVPASGRAQVEFTGVDVPFGEHRGEVRIQSGDKLPEDDVYRLALHHPETQAVLYVADQVRAGATPLFYRAALESANAGLSVHTESATQAAEAEDLSRYAYVVLEQSGAIATALEHKLDAYVRAGGRLLVAVGASGDSGQTPVTHLAYRLESGEGTAGFVDGQHAALRGLQTLGTVHFYRYAHVTPPADSKILARMANGAALLTDQTVGEGRVLTFAGSFENRGNDFALHPTYVPFVAQVGRYLAGFEESGNSNVAGETIELRRAREGGRPATVTGPSGKQELSLAQSATASTFDLYAEGFYEAQRSDGRRTLIAANADRRESDLTRIPEETLALMRNLGRGTGTGETPRSAGARLTTEDAQPRLLWRVILIAALIAASAESIVASRYWRKETHINDGA